MTCAEIEAGMPVPSVPTKRMPYYTDPNMVLGVRNTEIEIAVIMVHGTGRNADEYFCYMRNSVDEYYGKDRDKVLVIAPHFKIPSDNPVVGDLFWDHNEDWKAGYDSTNTFDKRVSSFTVLDDMLSIFADRLIYPSLKKIIVAGHSAGGQVVQRYALGTPIERKIDPAISVVYAPANPSSVCWLYNKRPSNLVYDTNCPTCQPVSKIRNFKFEFGVPDVSKCPRYNTYRYGLENLNTYMSQLGLDAMIKEYATRDVIYFQGAADTCNRIYNCGCNDHSLATGCESMLSGQCRFERGYAFFRSLEEVYGRAVHRLVEVPGIGHSGCDMFQSATAK
eukprot:CAMPEP_0168533772 /NCGR_PEP_ID=MMETSP0405-20121227/17351_1 /TAXON_ID=498012 /ORGANISM="Trichosphaerium sp, Strain Am-I-7 wt" /LENGTH=333 /DNA_ID=CAMNT_0008560047 /DNA_START=22 /DNA_END=1020 /DNA_ORIENTATION=+